MAGLPVPLDFITVVGNISPSKQFHKLMSVFAGIILCKIIYEITGTISLLYFKGYNKLSNAEKVDWKIRGVSTFHALIVAVASLYLLLFSDLFFEGSRDDLIINRNSTFSDTTLGVSLGYFLSDLAMIIWQYPALGGLEFVLHHGLSMFSIFLSLLSGQGQIYILMVLFSESTTPFVNLRWHLDVYGQKNSMLYIFNGVALFLMWLVARIFLFIYYFVYMFYHFDQVRTVFPLGFYGLITVPPVLTTMNVYWFWKIAKGMIKTLSKAKHSK